MTLTVTAAQDFSGVSPRIRLDLASSLGGSEWVTINRTHENGDVHRVITDRNARLSGGAWVGYDYHCPFEADVEYHAVTALETSAAVTTSCLSPNAWLIHHSDPTLSVEVVYIPEDGFGDDDLGDGAAVFTIRGSDRPATVWDDTMAITSSVKLGILPEQQAQAMRLLRSGGPVLLNVPAGWDVDHRWIKPKAKIARNLGRVANGGVAAYPYRMIEISYTWVRQPFVDLSPEWSYDTLDAAWVTLDALEAGYATLDDIITDTRI
jgi:hypothetical protein